MEQEIKTTKRQDVPQAVLTDDDLVELYFLAEEKLQSIKRHERSERGYLYLFRHDTSSDVFIRSVQALDYLYCAREFYAGLLCRLNEALGAEPLFDCSSPPSQGNK